MNLLDLLLLSLATWRLAYLITKESGPFDLVKKFRERLPLGGLTSCIYCASIWAAVGVYLVFLIFPPAIWIIAASGGAMLMWRYTGSDRG